MMRSRGGTRDASDTMTPSPPWIAMGLLTVAFAVPLALAMSPRTGLYWYIFPLFSIGITYVVQFRTQFSARWKATFVATAVLSVVALALDWPFSGHVLWNVLFIGHAYLTGKRRSNVAVGKIIRMWRV